MRISILGAIILIAGNTGLVYSNGLWGIVGHVLCDCNCLNQNYTNLDDRINLLQSQLDNLKGQENNIKQLLIALQAQEAINQAKAASIENQLANIINTAKQNTESNLLGLYNQLQNISAKSLYDYIESGIAEAFHSEVTNLYGQVDATQKQLDGMKTQSTNNGSLSDLQSLQFDIQDGNLTTNQTNLQDEIAYETEYLAALEQEINAIPPYLVPANFIFVQFGQQSDPTVLWPYYNWTEVTDEYSSLFLEAEGSPSVSFEGGTQEYSSPDITTINQDSDNQDPSVPLSVASNGQVNDDGFEVLLASEYSPEVIPYNSAIRIWKMVSSSPVF